MLVGPVAPVPDRGDWSRQDLFRLNWLSQDEPMGSTVEDQRGARKDNVWSSCIAHQVQ